MIMVEFDPLDKEYVETREAFLRKWPIDNMSVNHPDIRTGFDAGARHRNDRLSPLIYELLSQNRMLIERVKKLEKS